MSNPILLVKVSHNESFEYPYTPHDDLPQPDDVYNRKAPFLLASLACLGKHILASPDINIDRREIQAMIRICEDEATIEDVQFLLTLKISEKKQSSIILRWQPLFDQNVGRNELLPGRMQCNQVIFFDATNQRKWAIFLVSMSMHSVEVYTVGDCTLAELQPVALKISHALHNSIPNSKFTFKRRLQIPSSFQPNPAVTAFVLAIHLHRHSQYLELNSKRIMIHLLEAFKQYQLFHDNWLGKLSLDSIPSSSHPFITSTHWNDELQCLQEYGWCLIDVLGDGNSVFYSLILGLENNSIFDMSPQGQPSGISNMQTPNPWQSRILLLQQKLKKHSQLLLRDHLCIELKEPKWWWRVGANYKKKEDRDKLTDEFVRPKLRAEGYFHNDFCQDDSYHMRAFWAPLVFASLCKVRVVMLTRTTSWNGKGKKHSWSTTIFESSARGGKQNQESLKVVQKAYLERMPDTKFIKKPTIEIVFLTGFKENSEKDTQHFMFLRRVLCKNLLWPKEPAPHILRLHLARSIQGNVVKDNVTDVVQTNLAEYSKQATDGETACKTSSQVDEVVTSTGEIPREAKGKRKAKDSKEAKDAKRLQNPEPHHNDNKAVDSALSTLAADAFDNVFGKFDEQDDEEADNSSAARAGDAFDEIFRVSAQIYQQAADAFDQEYGVVSQVYDVEFPGKSLAKKALPSKGNNTKQSTDARLQQLSEDFDESYRNGS